jgi:predicted ester cyclase
MANAVGVADGIAERNLNIVQSFQGEIINQNYEAAKRYLHPDVVVHFPPTPPGSITPHDRDGVIEMFKENADWFTFVKVECPLWLAGEDTLFQVVELHFVHTGEFFGVPPTQQAFSISGLAGFRFKDGLILEHWGQYDMMSIPQKLGFEMPGPFPPAPPAQ